MYLYKNKKGKIFFTLSVFFLGTVFLSGCTTPEIRQEKKNDGGLVFDKTQSEEKSSPVPEKPLEKKTEKTTSPSNSTSQSLTQKKMYTTQPQMAIDTMKKYNATLKTSAGVIEIELDAKSVPQTVNNFVFLAKEKFYDGVIFHRTIKDFMIQGGDPTGTGMGGPGYKFADEPFTGEYTRGTVAMANAGPNTNGSQFFIMHKDVPLPKNYVIFGKVVSGLDVVDRIAEAPTKKEGEGSSPVTPVTIETLTIEEK